MTEKTKKMVGNIAHLVIFFCLIAIVGYYVLKGFSDQLDNREVMLCESALKSGNEVYWEKCQCYYETNDITCIYN